MRRAFVHGGFALLLGGLLGCASTEEAAGELGAARVIVNTLEESTATGTWQRDDVLDGASDEMQIWGGTGDMPDYGEPGFHCELLTTEEGRNVGPTLRENDLPATFKIQPRNPAQAHKPGAWYEGDADENACGLWLDEERGVCTLTSGKVYVESIEGDRLTGWIKGEGFLEGGGVSCSASATLNLAPQPGPRSGVAYPVPPTNR
ncbi:MAG: hypothetical protein AB2A00_38590 [Myxococcota bacterium]